MLKIREGGRVVSLNKGVSNIPLPIRRKEKIIQPQIEEGVIVNKITKTFVIEGLPDGATDIDGINGVIKDLHIQDKINLLDVSNTLHTFRDLYKEIADRDKEIERLKIEYNRLAERSTPVWPLK